MTADLTPEQAAQLKAETNILVFSVESELEQIFAEIDQISGPVIVYNL